MQVTERSYLLTKVTVPPMRPRLIPRSSLLSRLESRVPLTLLSAGAGYGKTTLLSAWAHTQRGHVAWVTLDEQENDPLRFWGYVLLALRRCIPLLEEADDARLPTDAATLPSLLIALLNTLSDREEVLTLVLDDYHVITEPAIHESLRFLIEHAPACLRLILATRIDPAFPLSRLRARGQLVEIREAALQVSAGEAADFLVQTMDLALSEEEVQALTSRTQGWIAGLQLAALALRSHPDTSAQVQHWSSSHSFLLDYLQEEILAGVPPATSSFLLHASVLTQMSPSLCTAVTGEQDAASMLEALVRSHLFVVPLDAERRWYRMHPLIREALLACVRRREPELVPRLHERASHWYAEQHLLHEAIAHALDAGDGDLAADLIPRLMVPQSWRNEYHTLRGWLLRLPQALLHAHPDLSLLLAQALFLTAQVGLGPPPQMGELLASAEQEYRRASNWVGVGSVKAARAILALFGGSFLVAFVEATEALALLPESDVQWRGLALSAQALEALMAGELDLSHTRFQQACACYDASGQLGGRQFVTVMLAELRLIQGDRMGAAQGFRLVLGLAQEAPELARIQLTDSLGSRRAHFERVAWYGLAHLAYEENRLDEAQHALVQALAEGQFPWIYVLSGGLLLQVRVLSALGEDTQAQALLETLQTRPQEPSVMREIQFCQAFLAFRRGDRVRVASWVAGREQQGRPLSRAREVEESVLLARLHTAEGEEEAAARLLAPLLEEARVQGRWYAVLQIQVVLSLAKAVGGHLQHTQETLREAVSIAQPHGSMRLFLDEGEAMERLLRELVPHLREHAQIVYVRAILDAFAKARAQDAAPVKAFAPSVRDALTPAEQRVLALLAQGASNQEIARALVIELSTAKSHVSHLLSKLGAATRAQAIIRARELSLL